MTIIGVSVFQMPAAVDSSQLTHSYAYDGATCYDDPAKYFVTERGPLVLVCARCDRKVLGAVALVHVRPDLAEYPLAEPDAMWQDFSASYIDDTLDSLTRWGDDAESIPKRILDFDRWLIATGRRQHIGTNRCAA